MYVRFAYINVGVVTLFLLVDMTTSQDSDKYINEALYKPAYISPRTLTYPPPTVAVDGDTNTHHAHGSCVHSDPNIQNKPWWKVDLHGYYLIRNVRLLNRGDCYCYPRLSNFNIYVGYDNYTNSHNELCHHQVAAVGNGAWLDAYCPQPYTGRYVIIQIMGPTQFLSQQILTLCEVQVYAVKIDTPVIRQGLLTLKGKVITEYKIVEYRSRSLLECSVECAVSRDELCLSFSVCSDTGSSGLWCHLGASYDTKQMQQNKDCNTYLMDIHP